LENSHCINGQCQCKEAFDGTTTNCSRGL
jgi:hypothetical protein